MIFAMQQLPGEFTSFDFIAGIPAPFNFGLAILMNDKMLTLGEKLQVRLFSARYFANALQFTRFIEHSPPPFMFLNLSTSCIA